MRILLIGNPDSIWTKEYIDKVLLPIGASVSLQHDPDAKGLFNDYYIEHGVESIAQYKLSKWIMKIPKIRVIYRLYCKKKALRKHKGFFDKVVILYVTPFSLQCASMLSGKQTGTVAVFIGSDILRSSKNNTRRLEKLLSKRPTLVVCESHQTEYAYNSKIGNKISLVAKVIKFGDEPFQYIDQQIMNGRKLCKEIFDIPQSLISICIGYNASVAQQHIRVIEQIDKLPDSIKEKLCIIVPVAYGGNAEYITKLDNVLSMSGVTYRILSEFLNPYKIAILRVATDIFINAQTTDSISASVMEAYYAGARLINAGWLNYQEFRDWDLDFDVFNSFEEIDALVKKNIATPFIGENPGRDIVLREWSWDTSKEKWSKLLKEEKFTNG